MAPTALVVENREPWLYRSFIKEKLYARERYWRNFPSNAQFNRRQGQTLVIPSGAVWRKYLPLWIMIANEFPQHHLILLESAVECMDWRNASACIATETGELIPESTATQEKNRLGKMVESKKISPFCDMSVRDVECDEFDLLDYPHMSVETRSRSALLRAGRMLLGPQRPNVVLVIDQSDLDDMNDDVLDIKVADSFFDQLCQTVSSAVAEQIAASKLRCEDVYKRRNAVTSDVKTGVEDYLSEEDVQKGIRDGSLARGRLDVTKQNFKEAYVRTSKGRFFINQMEGHFNRAIHQDVVIIKPLPESQWGCPVGRRRLVFNADSEENDASDNTSGPTVPSAIVVAIAQPSRRRYVATLVDTPSADDRAVIVVPVDTRIPKIRIQTKSWQKLENQRLLVEIDRWDVGSNYPQGHCIEILGPYGDLETEIACLLLEHEILFTPFSKSAIALLPPEGPDWRIPRVEIAMRRDLRTTCRIFSVDPVGCQDIDDTMHVRRLSNGDVEVGVHIADVAYFVPHNSALDKEAQTRATTFYLVDRRFDMLPTLLSSDLCSLHGNMDRLAVSVIWTMSPHFDQIKSTWFGRTVIHNCQAMTYEQAHNILHDLPPDDPRQPQPPPLTAGYRVKKDSIAALKKDLSMLTDLTRKLRRKREEIGGAVDLSSGDLGNELKFALDASGNPIKVSAKKDLEIHHTIAELMILANQSVAEKIYSCFPDSSLLRIHQSVEHNKFEDLESFLKAGGIAFDGSSNMSLAKSLKIAQVTDKDRTVVNALWQSLTMRAMSEALYVSTGQTESGASLSHYGLGVEKYTHFTSPIRRYADVVVHKQLFAALVHERVKLTAGPPPGFIERRALASMPDSKVISVLSGEGLEGRGRSECETKPDSFNSGVNATLPAENEIVATLSKAPVAPVIDIPYVGSEVARICENLNVQNRRAKRSSMECQKLFLSLYFKNRVASAQAVVTDVRANGLVVFVPQFDMKGPVYLCDESGNVQLDPSLVGLPSDSGLEPTLGFVAVDAYRRFSAGATVFTEDTRDASKSRLEIVIPGAKKKLRFCVQDVVTVQISCDLSDVKARVPLPRLHLVASSATRAANIASNQRIVSTALNSSPLECMPISEATEPFLVSNSIYEQIAALPITPKLPDAPSRPRATRAEFHSVIGGRMIFGRFVNPNTRNAQQEAAISAASDAVAQLRLSANQSNARSNEFDNVRTIERTVTARAQKLAAGKRNTRKAKGK
jgi:VacB/RNase II family 3'-5' exoribonuclease